MVPVYVLLFIIICATVSCQEERVIVENQTEISFPHNETTNAVNNVIQVNDTIDNLRFACGLTIERYNETADGDTSKVQSKLGLATVCCPGYKRDNRGICRPYCKGGCGDGFCEFPEICNCPSNCAFNTVDRKCVCFEATCPAGCPPNASCVADNTCDCNQGFIKGNNWTQQYTNSSMECIPYCFPFCTNKLFTIPERCVCNYTVGDQNETFGNESLENGFHNHQKSHAYLGHLFQTHGHPSFSSGLVGFGLGALVGGMIGSHVKSKNKFRNGGYGGGYPGYHVPGSPYGNGYGETGNTKYGGYAGHGFPGSSNYPRQGNNPVQGNNYGGSYQAQGTNYGGNYPGQGTYVHDVPPNTHYGTGGNYVKVGQDSGAAGQNTGGPETGKQHTQTNGGIYSAGVPGQTHAPNNPGAYGDGVSGQVNTQRGKGNIDQSKGNNYGWNTQGQGIPENTGHNKGVGTNYGWNLPHEGNQNTPGNTGKPHVSSNGWSVPGQTNGGTNTGQRTDYGWSVPTSSNTGTGLNGKGSSIGTGWRPVGSSGNDNSGTGRGSTGRGNNSGSGSKGKKRGRNTKG